MTISLPRFGPPRGTHRVLAVLAVVVLAVGAALTGTARPARAAAAYDGPQPGTFTGLGFDTCAAPSNAAMKAWLQSPYRAVGIYIGGVNRGCAQPNLTPGWVATQQAAGWRIFPLYVGLQAPCSTYQRKIDPARAAVQGREAADDAVRNARSLGLSLGSTITLDMERYPAGNAACTEAVNSFVSAWTTRLHEQKFYSGFYTNVASAGLPDQVAAYQRPGHARPDMIDFARWDGVQTVSDSALPASYWMPGQRMKQYQGDHHETWGGVRINIDSNYLDLRQPPRLQPSWSRSRLFRELPRILHRLSTRPPTR
ncbi:DUF1906 domain-containing protein [Micromonospora sp. NBC_00858]|uniref:DUF1906 domain-containing protein n=1 Tax=Micromonospora sp. NBC_00858 TaxID=2975979 RepID=UPI00386812C8|nr:DUF1906 domain-containing protein [Micromonospora sp. NBC_00858]